jgi:hypothetical protein
MSMGHVFLFVCGTGLEQSPLLLRPFIGLLYKHWMTDGDDCGAVSGMNDWQGQYSNETAHAELSPPHIPT